MGGSKEEALQEVFDFYRTARFEQLPVVQGSQRGVEILSQKNDLIVITSRPYEIYNKTKKWIGKEFPDTFARVELTNAWSTSGMTTSKAHLCKDLKVELMIEDSLEYAQECASAGIKTLLLDCPWNQCQQLPAHVYRVHSWEEIVNSINRH